MTRATLLNYLLFVGVFVCFGTIAVADDLRKFAPQPADTTQKKQAEFPKPSPIAFKPTIGLGGGMFTFYGDVANNHRNYHPTVSRIGFNLTVSQPLNPFLDANFYIIHGKIGANERTFTRNLNFESKITTGGITVSYNFHHFIKKTRKVEPHIYTGFESFEFLSKTDLYDANGNPYHYWSDGSIRNLPENDPGAANAIEVYRDYTYETDLRELNLDNFGKYPERSWSVPVGAGITFLMTDHWKFKFGTSMHFSLTDLVDNVSSESFGNRAGDKANDKFLYTGFSFHYNLHIANKAKEVHPFNPGTIDPKGYDLTGYDLADTDGDKVNDFIDDCPGTPTGVEVDKHGCPVDTDRDGIADYLDEEINTPAGREVDHLGRAIPDSVFQNAYHRFVDSTGAYAHYKTERSSSESKVDDPSVFRYTKRRFFVSAGGDSTKHLPRELIDYILSLKDVTTEIDENNNVVYHIGDYTKIEPAMMTQIELANKGINTNIKGSENGRELTDSEIRHQMNNARVNPTSDNATVTSTNTTKTIFRVQIGAFSRRVSEEIFTNVPNLVVVEHNDGLTRYLSGSFKTLKAVADHKINMLLAGFQDAFIVAYRDGKRISLSEAGATVTHRNTNEMEDVNKITGIDKTRIRFSIQLAAYNKEMPTGILDKFLAMGNVDVKKQNGFTKYILGKYATYEEAKAAISDLEGFPDAFVIGLFNNIIITLAEANKLLNNDE